MSSTITHTNHQTLADEVELKRLEALNSYQILDTSFEPEYYRLVAQSAAICETPISLITLLTENRQWFKARFGISVNELPRSVSFCQYAIAQDDVLEVPDALMDLRFFKNPLVTGDPKIRFYAGAPLVTDQGYRLGTLCVVDTEPRELSETQKIALANLADKVVALIQTRIKVSA